jgi:hypothetical protein
MSDEERDAIEREFEQHAAEEAAQAEAEAEAERAMSDEGKRGMCQRAMSGECKVYPTHCGHYLPHIMNHKCKAAPCPDFKGQITKCVPCSGEEAQDAGK